MKPSSGAKRSEERIRLEQTQKSQSASDQRKKKKNEPGVESTQYNILP